MSRITSHIEVGAVVAEKRPEGGSIYKNDKFVHLSDYEWNKLFLLPIPEPPNEFNAVSPITESILDETSATPIHVKLEVFGGIYFVDIRHYYINYVGEFKPSRSGVKLRYSQWEEIKEWALVNLDTSNVSNDTGTSNVSNASNVSNVSNVSNDTATATVE